MGTQIMEETLLEHHPSSSRNAPLTGTDNKLVVDENDFMSSIYDNAIPGACAVPGMCQASLEDQLDIFTNCRHPLFSFFREHHSVDMENGGDPVIEVEMLPAGAYVLPRDCEYCQAKCTTECSPFCARPKLYFQKKRPPFTKPDEEKWDSQNDHAKVQILICSQTSHDTVVSNSSSKSSSDSSSAATPTADVSALSYDSPPPTATAKHNNSWLW